jgi:hypothetical protein
MESLDQTQKEWVVINASRELLSIVKKTPGAKYADAIKFAKDIHPALFKDSTTGIDRKGYYEKLQDKYKQEALAVTRERNKAISAHELIVNRYNQIQAYLDRFDKEDEDPNGLKKESKDLQVLLYATHELVEGLERITENQAINNDSFKSRAGKLFINSHLGKFVQYQNKDDGTIFRVTVLHPNPSEGVIGADLIYEQYSEDEQRVRIVAIQYKIWNGIAFYFSQSDNLHEQLAKMNTSFCGKDFCKDCLGGLNHSENKYRLSYCMSFLKTTDKLQDPKKLTTTGYHVPICKIDSLKEKTTTSFKLSHKAIKNQSLKASTFEELFDAEMLGSRWMNIPELEDFYRKNKVFDVKERIILYAQGTKTDLEDGEE